MWHQCVQPGTYYLDVEAFCLFSPVHSCFTYMQSKEPFPIALFRVLYPFGTPCPCACLNQSYSLDCCKRNINSTFISPEFFSSLILTCCDPLSWNGFKPSFGPGCIQKPSCNKKPTSDFWLCLGPSCINKSPKYNCIVCSSYRHSLWSILSYYIRRLEQVPSYQRLLPEFLTHRHAMVSQNNLIKIQRLQQSWFSVPT